MGTVETIKSVRFALKFYLHFFRFCAAGYVVQRRALTIFNVHRLTPAQLSSPRVSLHFVKENVSLHFHNCTPPVSSQFMSPRPPPCTDHSALGRGDRGQGSRVGELRIWDRGEASTNQGRASCLHQPIRGQDSGRRPMRGEGGAVPH